MTHRALPLAIMVLVMTWICPFIAHADGIEGRISAQVEGDSLTVGDPFWYIVEMTVPDTASVQPPGPEADVGPFEIRDYNETGRVNEDGTRTITLQYQLVDFQVGDKQIASFSVPVTGQVDGEAVTEEYLAPPVNVTIHSVLPQNAKNLKPIYGPIMLLPWWYQYVKPVLIGLLVLAALVAGVVWWRRRSGTGKQDEEQPLDFHQQALADLDALASTDDLARGDFKGYYSELGDILRRWLEGRAGIQAMEETTALIRFDLQSSDFPVAWQHQALEVLGRADLAKFAKWEPTEAQARDDLDTTRELVVDQAPPTPDEEALQDTQGVA